MNLSSKLEVRIYIYIYIYIYVHHVPTCNCDDDQDAHCFHDYIYIQHILLEWKSLECRIIIIKMERLTDSY